LALLFAAIVRKIQFKVFMLAANSQESHNQLFIVTAPNLQLPARHPPGFPCPKRHTGGIMEKLSIKTPDNFIALMGHSLGFWPRESLVCMILDVHWITAAP
jgi:hypothetical protein